MSVFKDSQELERILGGFFRDAVKIPKGEEALISEYLGILTNSQNQELSREFFRIMTDNDKKLTEEFTRAVASGDAGKLSRVTDEILNKGKFIEETLQTAKMILRFNLREPELSITIDATEDPIGVYINDPTRKPSADFTLKADVANEFWNGKVNLALALTRKKIVARGPIPKILKLVKILGTMYGFYKLYLKRAGRDDLLIS